VPVSIDGQPERDFVVDSGAGMIAIPSGRAAALFQDHLIRPADFRGMGRFQIANGEIVVAQVYNLRSVTVGGHEVSNVQVEIYAGRGPSLLGQSFLKRFKSWSIDNNRRALVLSN
jgi:clan AA aspartic protease (TIGR02281 family)